MKRNTQIKGDEMTKAKKSPRPSVGMEVELRADGNPDHGQHGRLVKPIRVAVSDLAEASRVCRQFITEHDLGGGNWTGGTVYQDGKKIARVSYNGRVWDNGDNKIAI